MTKQRYPIGVQSFEEIRRGGYVYVDKTSYIHRLLQGSKYYFLGRPRRFGKSLLLSTIKSFFEGKRELFEGLAIASCDDVEWNAHPVIHLDLNAENYSDEYALDSRIGTQLNYYEDKYEVKSGSSTLAGRFLSVIETSHRKTGRQAVVLIDEYDKPILDTIHMDELSEVYRNKLRGFYSVLKSADDHLKFAILTGVTKFGHLNIFSGLNNLRDISLSNEYSGICGITERELEDNFKAGVGCLADSMSLSYVEAMRMLKEHYDGYHFSQNSPDVYNPYSVLNCLEDKDFRDYWFQTGTPTFLINLLRERDYNITSLEGCECEERRLYGVDVAASDLIPVLYQSGYLTIKGFDREFRAYTLGFPNKEVMDGFFSSLVEYYTGNADSGRASIRQLVKNIRGGDADGFMKGLQSFFSSISYEMSLDRESNFQNVLYVLLRLIGFYVEVEKRTSDGRIDILIETSKYVYVMELKVDSTPEDALSQINGKNYSLPYASDNRVLYKIGVNFSKKTRTITGWAVETEG